MIRTFLSNSGSLRSHKCTMSEVYIEPAKVVTFFALVSGISCASLGKAFILISDFVDPGSNSTLSSDLDFLTGMGV